jgi:LysM repeat protein
MKQFRRLFVFLVLNIIVSALTTLAILVVWDQMRGPLPKGLLPKALAEFSATKTPVVVQGEAQSQGNDASGDVTEEYIVYQVQAGDTFESIAQAYNISVEELTAVNGFTQSQPLGIGEVLRIPKHPRGSVIIESVIGAGDLETERIFLKHRGEGELSLVGWRIEDQKGNVFIFPQFPQLILYGGGAVNIYTRSGANTVTDLYWGLDKPIWSSGSTITLKDAQGNVRATYTVP